MLTLTISTATRLPPLSRRPLWSPRPRVPASPHRLLHRPSGAVQPVRVRRSMHAGPEGPCELPVDLHVRLLSLRARVLRRHGVHRRP